ncbi:MAG: hypothetical protein N2645_07525 [Clostridia bacterium]|nr:hypothetical protein [Clostridia bacterium]
MRAVVILGAGFSKNSGLPVQTEISALLLEKAEHTAFEAAVTRAITRFMEDIFGYRSQGKYIPSIDDIFTCMDFSIHAQHHMGIHYPPERMEAFRKIFVYRLLSVFDKKFVFSKESKHLLKILYEQYSKVDFIVLNWDTVLEKYLLELFKNGALDYCNKGKLWRTRERNLAPHDLEIKLIKTHGSINWLYCDNCRGLFNDAYNEIPMLQKAGFGPYELKILNEFGEFYNKEDFLCKIKCPICDNTLASHIATYRYRRSFRQNTFPDVWDMAEQVLCEADKWIFIGYSMPDADYEFKHLLKISQLKLMHKRTSDIGVDVVLLNDENAVGKYRGFFGSRVGCVSNGGVGAYLTLQEGKPV